jgi:hypothetical protein
MEAAQALQKEIHNLCPIRDDKLVIKKWNELDYIMQRTAYLYKQISAIHVATRDALGRRIQQYRSCLSILDRPDITRDELLSIKPINSDIAPGVSLSAIPVMNADMIPDTQLYFVSETGEWGVRIMGQLITGQVGEIRQYGKKHIPCRLCKPHDKLSCPMWHKDEVPGWLESQWIHTNQPPSAKNKLMRHVGSRSSLRYDIARLPPGEPDIRRRQLAHDLLVYLAISTCH